MNAMKKQNSPRRVLHLALTLFVLGCMLFTAILPVAAAYPKNNDKVADEAGVLSESTIRTIRNTNETLEADIGASIAVCTVKTTGDTDIAEYARGLFKDWKMSEGVLLLIAADDENYYFVQSVGVDKIITNEALTEIRDNDLEADFASGNIDRGVLKTVSRLSSLLVNGLEESASGEDDDAKETEEKGTTVGSVIVGFFKFLLWAVLILVIAFVAFFIAAMFNDDCAAIMQKYVFQRNKKSSPMPQDYYDERLYGQRRQQNPNAQRRRPNPYSNQYGQNYRPQNRQTPVNNGYSQNRQNNRLNGYNQNAYAQLPSGQYSQSTQTRNQNRPTYYNADGTQRTNQNARQGYNQQGYSQQNGYNRNQQQINAEETRAFTIPGRGQNQY